MFGKRQLRLPLRGRLARSVFVLVLILLGFLHFLSYWRATDFTIIAPWLSRCDASMNTGVVSFGVLFTAQPPGLFAPGNLEAQGWHRLFGRLYGHAARDPWKKHAGLAVLPIVYEYGRDVFRLAGPSRNFEIVFINNFPTSGGDPGSAIIQLAAPVWLLFALTAFAGLIWWWGRRRRRRPDGTRCRRCGYDLRATPDRCPECGQFAAARPDPAGMA